MNPKYIAIVDWGNHHTWPSVGGLRHLIFNRASNGFDTFRVVKKVGGRVFIDERAFLIWMEKEGVIK